MSSKFFAELAKQLQSGLLSESDVQSDMHMTERDIDSIFT